VANLLPSSATLIDQGPSDDQNFVDIDQMLVLSNAMFAARAALAADAAAAVDKLHTRLVFFESRRANADTWADELIALLRVAPSAAAASSSAEPTLLGLTASDFKRVRGLLFYRNCRYYSRLLRALNERIAKATRGNPPPNDLKMEFWATISSLRCCTEPVADNPISDEQREQGAALIRITAIRRVACGLVSSQATRLFDWLKQGELAGLISTEQAAPPERQPATPFKGKSKGQQQQQQQQQPQQWQRQQNYTRTSKFASMAGQKRGWNGGNNASAAAGEEPQLTAKQKRQHQKNQKRQKAKQRRAEEAAKEQQN
jgi:hypothetical protein